MPASDIRILLLALTGLCLLYLFAEKRMAVYSRKRLVHVVHVNGIRGKSSVTRLIEAGLRAGGLRVCAKTTGTLPTFIDVFGKAYPIRRLGPANIREQLYMLRKAAKQQAQVLVIECMAVDPALQRLTQHQMLKADIGVITNIRLDHTEEMGGSLEEICDALASTIPEKGQLFTAEQALLDRLAARAKAQHTSIMQCIAGVQDAQEFGAIDFPDNVAIALAVCAALKVPRQAALDGMREGYQRDPYALSHHRLPGGAVFINGMSINDYTSTLQVLNAVLAQEEMTGRRLILLINNRADRMYRIEQMIRLARDVRPFAVYLLGAYRQLVARRLRALGMERVSIICVREIDWGMFDKNDLIFAMGNITNAGMEVMRGVKEGGGVVVR